MRISDWSSDVCSSDLLKAIDALALGNQHFHRAARQHDVGIADQRFDDVGAGLFQQGFGNRDGHIDSECDRPAMLFRATNSEIKPSLVLQDPHALEERWPGRTEGREGVCESVLM